MKKNYQNLNQKKRVLLLSQFIFSFFLLTFGIITIFLEEFILAMEFLLIILLINLLINNIVIFKRKKFNYFYIITIIVVIMNLVLKVL